MHSLLAVQAPESPPAESSFVESSPVESSSSTGSCGSWLVSSTGSVGFVSVLSETGLLPTPVLVLASDWPVLRLVMAKLISQFASLHISTPFSITVTSSPTDQILASSEESTTMQLPPVCPGTAHVVEAAPLTDNFTDKTDQLISWP